MAIEKLVDFESYADLELKGELEKLEKAYQKLKFEHAVKGLEDPLELRTMRRNIARVNTEIRRRDLANGAKPRKTKKLKLSKSKK